jgi:hypothetical protein
MCPTSGATTGATTFTASSPTEKHFLFMTEGMVWARMAVDLDRLRLHQQAHAYWKPLLDLKVELFGRSDFRTCATLRDFGESLARGGQGEAGKALIQEAISHLARARHPEAQFAREAMADVLAVERGVAAAAVRKCSFRSCSKPGCTLRCGRCAAMWYCSQACQRADWTGQGQFHTAAPKGEVPHTAHKRLCPQLEGIVREARAQGWSD